MFIFIRVSTSFKCVFLLAFLRLEANDRLDLLVSVALSKPCPPCSRLPCLVSVSPGLCSHLGPQHGPCLHLSSQPHTCPPISRSAIPEDTPRPPPGSSSTRPGHEPPSSPSPASPGPVPPHAQAAAPPGEPRDPVSLQALAPSSELRLAARESRWPRRLGRQSLFIAGTPPPWPAPGSPPTSPRAARSDWGAPCGIARRQTLGTGSHSPGTWELAMDEEWGSYPGWGCKTTHC